MFLPWLQWPKRSLLLAAVRQLLLWTTAFVEVSGKTPMTSLRFESEKLNLSLDASKASQCIVIESFSQACMYFCFLCNQTFFFHEGSVLVAKQILCKWKDCIGSDQKFFKVSNVFSLSSEFITKIRIQRNVGDR